MKYLENTIILLIEAMHTITNHATTETGTKLQLLWVITWIKRNVLRVYIGIVLARPSQSRREKEAGSRRKRRRRHERRQEDAVLCNCLSGPAPSLSTPQRKKERVKLRSATRWMRVVVVKAKESCLDFGDLTRSHDKFGL